MLRPPEQGKQLCNLQVVLRRWQVDESHARKDFVRIDSTSWAQSASVRELSCLTLEGRNHGYTSDTAGPLLFFSNSIFFFERWHTSAPTERKGIPYAVDMRSARCVPYPGHWLTLAQLVQGFVRIICFEKARHIIASMTKSDDFRIPKGTPADVAHAIVKGAISGIPVAGGVAAEFFAFVLAPPLVKRRDEWFESLARRLRELELEFDQLGENPAFVTTVMHATQVAVRTNQEEKLSALRNAVGNTALGQTPDDDLRSLFLNFIEEFTSTHLQILKLIQKRTASNLPLLQDLISRREITDQMVLALERNGLLDDQRPYAARGRNTNESLLTFNWTVSNLGEQFLAFISQNT